MQRGCVVLSAVDSSAQGRRCQPAFVLHHCTRMLLILHMRRELALLTWLRMCVPACPPCAVRNLVEQAQFAHLCTVMSNMHHRRAGYPFGSLVDFAADGAGHPIFR